MDPNTAWIKLATAVTAERWEEAAEVAENLTAWVSKGGLPPSITGQPRFDRIVANAICKAIAAWEVD